MSEKLPEDGRLIFAYDSLGRNGVDVLDVIEKWVGQDGAIDAGSLAQMFTDWKYVEVPRGIQANQ